MLIPTEYIREFCREYDYPAEAEEALAIGYSKICACPGAISLLDRRIEDYQAGSLDLCAALKEGLASPEAEVHRYTQDLLFFICLVPHLSELYKAKGIPAEILHDTVLDLRHKLIECHKMYGIWGIFVASWFVGAFCMRRFTVGRFQYEFNLFKYHFTCKDFTLEPKTNVLNIHIPSFGSLTEPVRHESYLQAYAFFHRYFPETFYGSKLFFTCESWLLYPPMRELLPPDSNILSFMGDFHMVSSFDDPTHHDFWRIFYHRPEDEDLPQETYLQKTYLQRVRAGLPGGEGLGLFCIDNYTILKGEEGIFYE